MLLHLIEQRLQIFTLIQGVKMSFMSDENCLNQNCRKDTEGQFIAQMCPSLLDLQR